MFIPEDGTAENVVPTVTVWLVPPGSSVKEAGENVTPAGNPAKEMEMG
jgi:hypothetical protein